jgi:hypothetical protein
LVVRYGSLIIGAIKSALTKKKPKTMESGVKASRGPKNASFSFVGGMQVML